MQMTNANVALGAPVINQTCSVALSRFADCACVCGSSRSPLLRLLGGAGKWVMAKGAAVNGSRMFSFPKCPICFSNRPAGTILQGPICYPRFENEKYVRTLHGFCTKFRPFRSCTYLLSQTQAMTT